MKRLFSLTLVLLAASIATAWSQTYPSRPITAIVPYAAGGPTDIITRVTAEHMRSTLGQPIIVENVVGAGGTIGVGRVARAAPDGYTIILGNWGSFAVTGAIYTLPYDLRTDFEPISPVATEPLLICAKQSAPPKDLRELLAWVKANDDKLSTGTSGVGGPSHVAGVVFQQMTGTRFQMVPYRGAAPATQALVAGQHDFGIVRAGRHPAACALRYGQMLRGHGRAAAHDRARISERRRGRPAGHVPVGLARLLGAKGHSERDDRQAECCNRRSPRRPGGDQAPARSRSGVLAARAADPGNAGRVPQGRNRALVADHQGCRYQGGLKQLNCAPPMTVNGGGLNRWTQHHLEQKR